MSRDGGVVRLVSRKIMNISRRDRDFYIERDWLLIDKVDGATSTCVRSGTHSDLFSTLLALGAIKLGVYRPERQYTSFRTP